MELIFPQQPLQCCALHWEVDRCCWHTRRVLAAAEHSISTVSSTVPPNKGLWLAKMLGATQPGQLSQINPRDIPYDISSDITAKKRRRKWRGIHYLRCLSFQVTTMCDEALLPQKGPESAC